MNPLMDQFRGKIKSLNELLWEHRVSGPRLDDWLANFTGKETDNERLHAAFLLGQFMYFGLREMRVLLHALYRDLFRYPIVERIRRNNGNTLDAKLIEAEFQKVMLSTRFLGMGNPSESGVHLLYYFRQENQLPKTAFIHTHEIFQRGGAVSRLRDPGVTDYVFVDDFCGSGLQAELYSRDIVEEIKAQNSDCTVHYYALVGMSAGIQYVRKNTKFDRAEMLVELGPSFRCFDGSARCFVGAPNAIDRVFAQEMCHRYGALLEPDHPLGFAGCELLIGFFHNTPDNTLPILWKDSDAPPWTPVFRRYHKKYSWGAK